MLVIARLTFREASRRKILWAALILGVLFIGVYTTGLHFIYRDARRASIHVVQLNEMRNFLLMAGLYVVNFLIVMMAVLTSVDTLSGEIASGSVQSIVTKPIRRWEVFAGKLLGFMGMLTLYVLLMAGGVMLAMRIVMGYSAPHAWRGLGLMWLTGMLMLSVSLCGGAALSTLANGVLVFGLFGVAFVGGWIEQIGSFVENQAAITVGILSSLIMPSEALWKRAAYEMRSPLVDVLGFSPFSSSSASVPSTLMIVYAVGYMVFMWFWGMWLFQQRDL